MTDTDPDPAADAARAAAAILAPDLGPALPVHVEAALAARDAEQRPGQYIDPNTLMTLAGLIVSIATLAWTIYNDQRERTAAEPEPETIERQVRMTLREQDIALPNGTERITEVVVTQITRQGSSQR